MDTLPEAQGPEQQHRCGNRRVGEGATKRSQVPGTRGQKGSVPVQAMRPTEHPSPGPAFRLPFVLVSVLCTPPPTGLGCQQSLATTLKQERLMVLPFPEDMRTFLGASKS